MYSYSRAQFHDYHSEMRYSRLARYERCPPSTSLPRYAVITILDGARPDYFKLASMPNLRWLMRHGTTYNQAFVGQLIADTPPSHATIGSGLFPKHHGVLGFWWKDPGTDRMTGPTDPGPVQTGALERVLAAHGASTIAGQRQACAVSPPPATRLVWSISR